MKKKKIKNLIILILIIIIFIIGGIFAFKYLNANPKNKNVKDVENVITNSETSTTNQYEKISYYKSENLDRYIAYTAKYNYSDEKTVLYVNMNLDYDFYDSNIINTISYTDNDLVLINKYNKIAANYSPKLVTISSTYATKTLQATNDTVSAFEKLCSDASKENLTIRAVSAYRTYAYQENLYNKYVAQDGKSDADKYSARPGFSEHHTGLAIDVMGGTTVYTKFDTTSEYTWLSKNAHLYGFIIRYQKDKTDITGYKYEPWHIRYVGVTVATYIYEHNISFDEYYAMFLDK